MFLVSSGWDIVNHLEQLVSEWLQYKGYFVRTSIPVGRRPKGGYEGELDVVAIHFKNKHLLHVECSLDAWNIEKRHERFAAKFERGRRYVRDIFEGMELPEELEQVVVLQFASGVDRHFGGTRLVTVRELVHEIVDGLKGTSPASSAVPSNFPLIRTLQLASDAMKHPEFARLEHRLIPLA
ncbi:hypothetical protein [Phenylobacterium sp.]|uniref:hypothetical protein n=1 Tax=Phenylobacterium sp. TaxID=1871053 RepID=UPI002732767E|nr:hypothetical protein [Phenylobacterium sp.]MDP3659218.1 hypothetical protein [Phenylobacterium sp.]